LAFDLPADSSAIAQSGAAEALAKEEASSRSRLDPPATVACLFLSPWGRGLR
jgi:hypothetical protein